MRLFVLCVVIGVFCVVNSAIASLISRISILLRPFDSDPHDGQRLIRLFTTEVTLVSLSMLQLKLEASSTIVRRGDRFSVILYITNRYPQEVEITRVTLRPPIGFSELRRGESGSRIRRLFESLKKVTISVPGVELEFEQQPRPSVPGQPPPPFIAKLQPGNNFGSVFNVQAGSILGLQPRPDTYLLTARVEYKLRQDKKTIINNESIETKLSIFPSIAGMLGGAVFGSLLGTVLRVGLSSMFTLAFISSLFTSVVLALIAGIALMRKKDVQPILTVEDFWGGIFLGFLVGFAGLQALEQLTGIKLLP